MINHEKLDCYQRSLTMIKELQKEMPTFPLGSSHLKDQLRRALISISLNIAEGASKPYPKDKRRFYAIARGSAGEVSACIDVCLCLNLLSQARSQSLKFQLFILTKQLSALMKATETIP